MYVCIYEFTADNLHTVDLMHEFLCIYICEIMKTLTSCLINTICLKFKALRATTFV